MSEEATIPQLPNNVSPPLTSLIELSNADVSQHTSLGNVFSQITGDALININGTITISNGIVNNAKIAANAVTTPKILDNNVTLAKLATGTAGNLISYAPSGQPVAVATGTAGQVLTSNGVGMAPTFQTVSGTGGITSINNSTAAAQTFAANNGVTLVDAGATHTFSIDTTTVATLTGTQTLTNKTLSTGTVFSAVPTINDGIRFEFSPNATNAGINVGSFGGEPSSPNNGDLVYDSSANQLKAYIASNWVALGSGSGPTPTSLNDLTDVTIATAANTNILIYDSSDSMWKNQTLSGDATIDNTGILTISANVIDNANLASGIFSNITGIGEQSNHLDMSTNSIIGVTFIQSDATNPASDHFLRLARTEMIGWRNQANDADLELAVNVSNDLMFNDIVIATLTGTQTLTNKTLSTGTTFSAAPTINAGIRFTFSPDTTNAGINVGSFGGEPSSPNNGDLVYDSSANQLKAYIASNWVALGDGGGTTPISLNELTDVIIDTVTAANVLIYDSTLPTPGWKNQSVSGDATISNTGVFTVSNNAISLAKLATGTAGNLISYDSMGDPEAVATGTAGQVLTSRGSALPPTFQDPSGTGGIVTINNDTTTAQTFNADTGLSITDNGATHTYGIDTTVVATLSGVQTLTNKTITADDNSLSIALSNLSNVTTTAPTDADILIYNNENTQWEPVTMEGGATISNAGVLTISNSVIENANVASGTFANITGIGTQTQALNMNTHAIQGVTFLQSNTTNPALSGVIRLARSDTIVWRNVDNDGNLPLTVNGTDNLVFESDPVVLAAATQTLTNKTLTTPTIGDFTNATHDHSNNTNGGNLTNSALTSGIFSSITGIGEQTQALNMGEQSISNVDHLQSDTTDPAVTGVIRVANTDIGIAWRNEANSGDLPLAVNTSNALMFNAIVIATVSGTQTLTNKTFSTGTTFSAAPTINDGTKFTFSPTATNAGINVGSIAGNANPTTPIAGDLYYNSTDNELRAYIGSAWISLGPAGGATSLNELSDVTITTAADTNILIYDGSSTPTGWKNQSVSGDATIDNTGILTISNNVIENANVASGTFANITGIGTQTQALNMNTHAIQGVTFLQSNTTNTALSGVIRLARSDTIVWRNVDNDGNLPLTVNGTDNLVFESDPVVLAAATQTLTNKTFTAADNSLSIALTDLSNVTIASAADTNILIYDGSSTPTGWKNQSVSGDATIDNTGVFTVSNNAISLAKAATGTAGNLISYAPSGQPVAVATGTPGQILTSRGAGLAPTFQSLTVEGGTGITVTTSNITYTVNIDSTVATLSGTQTLTNKTLTTPTIGDFTNATHDHSNNTNGGNLTNSALTSGIFSSITGIGEQTQALNMNAQAIQGVTFLQSNTANTALSGVIRLARSDTIVWRNVDNDGNLPLTVNGTDNLVFESDPVVLAAATQTLTNKTFSTGTTFSAAPTINDGTKFTFSPNGTNPGLNVGSHTADPSTSEDGDVYYNSTDNELKIRVNNEWETVNTSQMTVNFSNGTYSHPNGTAENTVLTVTTNQDRTTVSYDMSTLTQNTVIRVKEEVDGTTEEIISEKTWPTDFAANTQAAEIELIGKNRDQTITFQSTTAEGAIRAIPFARRDDVVE